MESLSPYSCVNIQLHWLQGHSHTNFKLSIVLQINPFKASRVHFDLNKLYVDRASRAKEV